MTTVLVTGGGLVAILTHTRRKKQHLAPVRQGSRHNPLTQTVPAGKTKGAFHLPWNRPGKSSGATLVRLKEDGQPFSAPPIPIPVAEMTFGSDPMRVMYILDDPSVSPLHARLKVELGEFILSDERSTAGTWVNYEQVITPRRLRHGDLINFGRRSYRFMLKDPPERPAPRIIPTEK